MLQVTVSHGAKMGRFGESRPTIRDVAHEARVSHQTVSRVLNDHPQVAPATRARVLHAIRKLGYERNLAAQMLTTQRSQIIQVITVDGKFPFEVPLLDPTHFWLPDRRSPDRAAPLAELGYAALYTECTSETLARTLEIAAARMVDGVFLYAPQLHIADDELLAMANGTPLVRRDFVLASRKITWVGFDQVRATQLAVQHLLDLGHRQIAIVTGTLRGINARWRYDTWRKTLVENGLEPGPAAEGDFTTTQSAVETGYQAMLHLLDQGHPFTAVIVANDTMAIGALHAIRERGLQVPEHLSVISYNNAPFARFLDPPLTTIAFDFDVQNRLAFQFLFERIQDPHAEPHQHVLLPELRVRESTCAPK